MGTVTITDGTLKVTNKLYTGATGFTVGESGELQLTADVVGLSINANGEAVYAADKDSKKSFNGIETNNGMIVVEGLTGEAKDVTTATDIAKQFGTSGGTSGLVDLTGLTIKGISVDSKNEIQYSKITDLQNSGLVIDALKNATVTEIKAGNTLRGEYGSAVLEAGQTALEVDKTLILNGTGNLVQAVKGEGKELAGVNIEDLETLITTGEGAVIGAVNGSSTASRGEVYVASGDLTVQGNVNASLDVAGKLTVNGDVNAAVINIGTK